MVISPLTWVITTVTLLIAPLITAHEPPSTCWELQEWVPTYMQDLLEKQLHHKARRRDPGFHRVLVEFRTIL